jgi:hypothetical protein
VPLYVWAVCAVLVGSSVAAMLWQRDAWPFSHYPMFSGRITAEDVVVFRIAVEDSTGRVGWWRPHVFRLQDRLCTRFAELARHPQRAHVPSAALLELFAQTQRLILAESPGSNRWAAILFIRRRVERLDRVFTPRDEVVARVPFPGEASLLRRASGR